MLRRMIQPIKLLQQNFGFGPSVQSKTMHILTTPFACQTIIGQHVNPIASRVLVAPANCQIIQSCGLKVKGRLRKRCKDCYFVVRKERAYIICETHPRHKQMAQKKDDDKSWILTHATQSPIRPY